MSLSARNWVKRILVGGRSVLGEFVSGMDKVEEVDWNLVLRWRYERIRLIRCQVCRLIRLHVGYYSPYTEELAVSAREKGGELTKREGSA
jgi:hypothetical protein